MRRVFNFIKTNRRLSILLVAELISLLLYIAFLFTGTESTKLSVDSFNDFSIKKGTYTVQVEYSSDTAYEYAVTISSDESIGNILRSNHDYFLPEYETTNLEIWALRDIEHAKLEITCGENAGTAEVYGATLIRTHAWDRIRLCNILLAFLILNTVVFLAKYDKESGYSKDTKLTVLGLSLVIIFAAMPVMIGGITGNADLGYHLMRIEGLKDGILSGQFPVRISPQWLQGYGYASPIFYSETFLIVPALLRMIGYSLTTSYLFSMFIFAIATVLIAYFSFKGIFKEKYVALICAAVQALSVYRTGKVYGIGAMGELFGVMLMPLFVYGFYKVFAGDLNDKKYKRTWIPLTVAFTLLIQSHLLSCELVGLFTVLLCLIEIKKVFRKETFIVLAKTVIYTCLLSAWFLVPFLDYFSSGYFVINNVSARKIQEFGMYPVQLLTVFTQVTNLWETDDEILLDGRVMQMGILQVIALVFFMVCWARKNRGSLSEKEWKLGKITSSLGLVGIIFSLKWFPWDAIQEHAGVLAGLISSIQFPHRFLTISTVLLTCTMGLICKRYIHEAGWKQTVCALSVLSLILINNVYYIEDMVNTSGTSHIYSATEMGTGYVSGGEYLPYGADADLYIPHKPVTSGNLEYKDYKRDDLYRSLSVVNPSDIAETIQVDLLFYEGYKAFNKDTGEQFDCFAGDNFEVTVSIPAGYAGNITIEFISPWYWRAGEIITVLTVLSMILYNVLYTRKEKLNGYNIKTVN